MKQFYVDVTHFGVGMAIVMSVFLSESIILPLTLMFISYEVFQWLYLGRPRRDRPHRAIKFALTGMIFSSIFYGFKFIVGYTLIGLNNVVTFFQAFF